MRGLQRLPSAALLARLATLPQLALPPPPLLLPLPLWPPPPLRASAPPLRACMPTDAATEPHSAADEAFMRVALEEAAAAFAKGEVGHHRTQLTPASRTGPECRR